jgi:hypothetical protein
VTVGLAVCNVVPEGIENVGSVSFVQRQFDFE